MPQQTDLANVTIWRNELGLFPINLYRDGDIEKTFVLLNGTQGNFCLDLGQDIINIDSDSRHIAWSSNVSHYVSLTKNHIEVQRWDQNRSYIERYNLESVAKNLEKFHEYLEQNVPRQELTVVSHAMKIFRSLRAVLGNRFNGIDSLKAFLYLLACATDQVERDKLSLKSWELSNEASEIIHLISIDDWHAMETELTRGRPIENLVPNLSLLLRHSSGQLFQDAHYEAIFISPDQLRFQGFLPNPIGIKKDSKFVGLHFTPPALVRTIVEMCLEELNLDQSVLTIFDPACGSGEFLRETLRQLRLKKYMGEISIIGWDISASSCDMAKFILAWEMRNIDSKVHISIQCSNSLNPEVEWPRDVNIVLMNPPFRSWQDMDINQRKYVENTLEKVIGQRSDLSHAFIYKAANSLSKEGILGTIVPASFLDNSSSAKLRGLISEQLSPIFIARLGSQLLFSNAMIDVGLYIAKKDVTKFYKTQAPISFWADYRSESNSAGLRTLRKLRYIHSPLSFPIEKEGFSIYINPDIGRGSGSWAPRPYSAWKLHQRLTNFPRVGNIFDVKQGVRTGDNNVFLMKKSKWKELPENEKVYFRPAVINKSINFGCLNDNIYVFYPYGEFNIDNETELEKKLPKYSNEYLLPAKNVLKIRSRIDSAKWWVLSEHTAWQVDRNPKLVSTYFGDAGSFAWDETGEYIAVQGFGWIPKNLKRSKQLASTKLALAYLAILNSKLFSELLSAVSNHVGGGQWNLSRIFVEKIALPDLYSEHGSPDLINQLSSFGKDIHEGLVVNENKLNELINVLYGINTSL